MKIGILETGHVAPAIREKHGNYAAMFARLLDGYGFSFTNYAVVDQVFPDSVHAEEGWIISGSRHGAYEAFDWIAPLEAFIRDAYAEEVPMVGICFGHQIMAQAFGSRVEKFSEGWAIGPTDYQFNTGETVPLIAMHQDQVVTVPPEATVIASNAFCAHAAFAYKGKALSYQPHPEFTPEFTTDLIGVRIGKVFPTDVAEAALEKMSLPVHSQRIGEAMAKFLLENRCKRAKVA